MADDILEELGIKFTADASEVKKGSDEAKRALQEANKAIENTKNTAKNFDVSNIINQFKKMQGSVLNQKDADDTTVGKVIGENIKADFKNVNDVVDDIRKNLKTVGEKVEIDIDAERSAYKIKKIKNEIADLKAQIAESRKNNIDFDTSAAEQKISQLEAKLNELKGNSSFGGNQDDTAQASSFSSRVISIGENIKNNFSSAFSIVRASASSALPYVKAGLSKVGSIAKSVGHKLGSMAKRIYENISPTRLLSKKFSELGSKIIAVTRMMVLRTIIRNITNGITDAFNSAAKQSQRFNASMSQMYSSLKYVQSSIASAVIPIINALAPLVSSLADRFAVLADQVARAFAYLTGQSTYTKAVKQNLDYAESLDNTSAGAENLNKSLKALAGFDELNILNKDSSSDSSSSSDLDNYKYTDVATGFSSLAEQFKQAWADADFSGIGETVASKIVSALQGIDWDSIKEKASKVGKSFATFINGLFEYTDKDGNTLATSIGTTIGESFNTIVNVVYEFVTNLKWGKIGSEISKGISNAVKSVNWKKLIKTSYKAGEGLAELLLHLFTDKDKDGDTTLSNITKAIANLVNCIIAFVKGAVDKLNKRDETGKSGWTKLGESITQALVKGIAAVNWKDLVTTTHDIAVGMSTLIKAMFNTLNEVDESTGKTYGQELWNSIGKNIVAGVIAGLVAAGYGLIPYCAQNCKTVYDLVYNGLCDAFDINSPAKKMYPIGSYIIQGVFQGILEWIKDIKTWFQKNVFNKITDAWNDFKELTVSFKASISEKLKEWRTWFADKSNRAKELLSSFKESISEKLKDWREWFADKSNRAKELTATFKKLLGSKMENWRNWFSNTANNTKSLTASFKSNIASALQKFIDVWNALKDKAITLTATLFSKDGNGNSSRTSLTESIWNTFKDILGFAGGGFPNSADFFYANENGIPEYIGRMGQKPAVANNDQIKEGIKQAVYDAIVSANGITGNQNVNTVANINVKIKEDTLAKANYDYNTKKLRQGGVKFGYV